jgi:hypothetical protein
VEIRRYRKTRNSKTVKSPIYSTNTPLMATHASPADGRVFDGVHHVMDLTRSQILTADIKSAMGGSVLPIGILILVAMMVLPLPVFLLDTFFVVNIVLSLLILNGRITHPPPT